MSVVWPSRESRGRKMSSFPKHIPGSSTIEPAARRRRSDRRVGGVSSTSAIDRYTLCIGQNDNTHIHA